LPIECTIFYDRSFELDIISFATPLSRIEDLKCIKNLRGNFIYFISTTGITGSQIKGFQPLEEKVKSLRDIVGSKKIMCRLWYKRKKRYS